MQTRFSVLILACHDFENAGYADEEDCRNARADQQEAAAAAASVTNRQKGNSEGNHHGGGGVLSPDGQQMISDIEAENLAADFDGSLSGLGVEIHSSSFSMSEALNALPNLSISSSQIFKQEVTQHPHHHHHQDGGGAATIPGMAVRTTAGLKQEVESAGQSNKSFGALDLSNDEAHLPENADEVAGPGPVTFTGSVSREGTPSSLNFNQHFSKNRQHQQQQQQHLKNIAMNLSSSNPNLSTTMVENHNPQQYGGGPGEAAAPGVGGQHKVMLEQQQDNMKLEKRSYETIAVSNELDGSLQQQQVVNNFQYILAASTSIATKLNEPSITYLNQGQAYELRLKKLGDLSQFRKRHLKSVMRICFHERRLQYMEAEQIAEWSNKHPGERIIDVDLPLSYGVVDPQRDPNSLNSLTFKWDATRDTGIFIKVNCISTEFTPKKHGGEKGVPFRLQVETYDNDHRVHAAGCILQVFKLKGADRKHKQDRDKIGKRPMSEQEKFSPSYDCTMLADLPIEQIYVPVQNSRSGTPVNSGGGTGGGGGGGGAGSAVPESPVRSEPPVNVNVNNEFIAPTAGPIMRCDSDQDVLRRGDSMPNYISSLEGAPLFATASVQQVVAWLKANRYASIMDSFRNYNGRDMLRLLREEILLLVGPADGMRLYNDLHMVSVFPRTTFYVGAKDGDNEFSAIYLEELTVHELLRRLSDAFGFGQNILRGAYVVGPLGILVRVTNEVLQHTKPETVFQFSLRTAASNHGDPLQQENGGGHVSCEVILEEVTNVQGVTNDSISPEVSNDPNSC